ncbi:hypothetical protein D0A38_16855 [Xanthomonas campestris pv. incanae]|nr:hypothetical protein D0A38_16855 [Xanthomonas campestris pv. incanae]
MCTRCCTGLPSLPVARRLRPEPGLLDVTASIPATTAVSDQPRAQCIGASATVHALGIEPAARFAAVVQ